MTQSEAIRVALVEAAARRTGATSLAAEAARLAGDEIDVEEVAAVRALMDEPVRRGDVVRLQGSRTARGQEQRGERFGVVLQAGDLLALSTVIVAPTSTRAQPASFRPEITVRGRRTHVLVDQLTAVDRTRLGRRATTLGWQELAELDTALALVLGLRA